MKNQRRIWGAVLSALVILYLGFIFKASAGDKDKINWLTIEEAQEMAKKSPKKIFVDVYAVWCGPCKKMDQVTFHDPKVVEFVNKNYYAVKLDAESTRKISYRGKKMTETELAMSVFNVQAYPTIVFIEKDFSNTVSAIGYQPADRFETMLKEFHEGKAK
jgi:thioredoxin-related protein